MRSRFARYRAQLPARLRARLNRQLGQRRSPAEPSHDANASHDRNSPVDRWWLRYLSSLPEDARAVIEPLPTATNQVDGPGRINGGSGSSRERSRSSIG